MSQDRKWGPVEAPRARPPAGAQRAFPRPEVLISPFPVSLLFHFQEPVAVGKKIVALDASGSFYCNRIVQ